MLIWNLAQGLAIFVVTLLVLTLGSAYVADVTGRFRLLFIRAPYRPLFRAARWMLAGLVAVLSVLAVAE